MNGSERSKRAARLVGDINRLINDLKESHEVEFVSVFNREPKHSTEIVYGMAEAAVSVVALEHAANLLQTVIDLE